jgi:hypothetical protein
VLDAPSEPFADLDLILFDFRQRDDLLDVDKNLSVEIVWLQPDASDVDVVVDEPENGGRQFFRELGSGKNDTDILGELIIIRLIPTQEIQDRSTSPVRSFQVD